MMLIPNSQRLTPIIILRSILFALFFSTKKQKQSNQRKQGTCGNNRQQNVEETNEAKKTEFQNLLLKYVKEELKNCKQRHIFLKKVLPELK